jgi:hypothetical protein
MRTLRLLRFQIAEWSLGIDRVRVQGRNCGDGLRVGDQFAESTPWSTPESTGLRLRIERIRVHGESVSHLQPGKTAELELSGFECERAAARIELHGRSTVPLIDPMVAEPAASGARPGLRSRLRRRLVRLRRALLGSWWLPVPALAAIGFVLLATYSSGSWAIAGGVGCLLALAFLWLVFASGEDLGKIVDCGGDAGAEAGGPDTGGADAGADGGSDGGSGSSGD